MSFAAKLARTAIASIALLTAAPAEAAPRCRAIDGDTVRCGRERIRLREVYAAERGTPGAEAERHALQRRLDAGEVKIRRHGKDAYGRTLGDVYVNGRKVSQADVGPRDGRGSDHARSPRGHQPRAGARSTRNAKSY